MSGVISAAGIGLKGTPPAISFSIRAAAFAWALLWLLRPSCVTVERKPVRKPIAVLLDGSGSFALPVREGVARWDQAREWLRDPAVARGLEERGDSLGAARTLVAMYEDLVGLSDEMGKLQYDIMVERVEGRMAGLLPASRAGWSEVEQRYAAVRLRPKKSIGPDYFVHKLSRKLIRASLDGLTYTTPLRYLSDSVDGQPFLFVYLYLPMPAARGWRA